MIVDLFAGPGGWSVAIEELGLSEVGIEWDDDACETRKACGYQTVQADISDLDPMPFGPIDGLIASPPCTDWSRAGKRAGLDGLSGHLVREVPRWVEALMPTWIACEQVPDVLPFWLDYARLFETMGYSTWAGILSAERCGVPQTRQRAILMARRDGRIYQPPAATHQAYSSRASRVDPHADLFGETLLPWVSMAEALGWGMTERPYLSVAAGTKSGGADSAADGGSGARASLERERREGRWTVATRGDSGRHQDEFNPHDRPSRVVTGKIAWTERRPSTTVMGDPRIAPAGHHDSQMNDAIRVTIQEALILQGFRPDYPLQGTKTSQFQQVGNAIPPPLAKAILKEFTK